MEILSKEYSERNQELQQKYQQDIGQYECFLTCQHFLESLQDEDCLCLTFSVTRSELSIVRPESLKIVDIFPTIISAKSFIEAVKHAIQISPQKSGGFNKQEGQIIKGVASEYVNAALPFFINDSHWSIARLWMEPILGWVTTLDALGYHHAQKRTIPFLLFDKILQMSIQYPQSDFLMNVLTQIKKTCVMIMLEDEEFQKRQILIENSKASVTLKEDFMKTLQNILERGVAMMNPDQIINIKIFLAKFYLAREIGWINMDNLFEQTGFSAFTFLNSLIEEQLRRIDNQFLTVYQLRDLLKDINQNNTVSLQKHKERYFNLMKSDSCFTPYVYSQICLNKVETQDAKQLIAYSLNLWNQKLEENLFFTNENTKQFICMFMQNQLHSQPVQRKNSISLQEYKSPFVLEQCQQFYDENLKLANDTSNTDFYIQYTKLDDKIQKPTQIGSIYFTTPKIPQQYVFTMTNTKSMEVFQELLEKMTKFKSSSRWYFWVLVSKNAVLLQQKIVNVVKKFGPVKKITNYHHYLFGLQNSLDTDFLNKISE